jgi:hypothetical protein
MPPSCFVEWRQREGHSGSTDHRKVRARSLSAAQAFANDANIGGEIVAARIPCGKMPGKPKTQSATMRDLLLSRTSWHAFSLKAQFRVRKKTIRPCGGIPHRNDEGNPRGWPVPSRWNRYTRYHHELCPVWQRRRSSVGEGPLQTLELNLERAARVGAHRPAARPNVAGGALKNLLSCGWDRSTIWASVICSLEPCPCPSRNSP